MEAVLEAEGVAIRPGPRPQRNLAVVEALREAIKSCRLVKLLYHYRGRNGSTEVEVEPYGILLGSRHYLVAHKPSSERGPFLRMYSLPEIERAEVLEVGFVRDPAADNNQKIRVSLVTRPLEHANATAVRVTFQRFVWNTQGQLSKIEGLGDPELYQEFFERLSQSVFLTAHEI